MTRTDVVTHQFQRALRQRQAIAARGVRNLEAFRLALHGLVRTTGLHFVIDPGSDPRLRDYLVAGCVGAVDGAVVGGMLGLGVGTLAKEPEVAALGALLGALIGALIGVYRVSQGVRIRVSRGLDGTPELLALPI